MKKIICVVLCVVLLCGCSFTDGEQKSMFVLIERAYAYQVVYHKDTKVMYTISDGSYNRGTFTLLVNADGTPMLYKGGVE